MRLYLEATRKRKFWSRYPVNNSSVRPSTINVLEAVRLCAFAPPSSSLDRHCVVVFPRSMNNPGWRRGLGAEGIDSKSFPRPTEAALLAAGLGLWRSAKQLCG